MTVVLDVPDVQTASAEDALSFTASVRAALQHSDAEILFAALDIFCREYHKHDHGDGVNEEDFATVASELWALATCLNRRAKRTN